MSDPSNTSSSLSIMRIDQFEDPVRFREGDLPDYLPDSLQPEVSPNEGAAQLPYVLRAINVGERPLSRWELIRELTRQIPLDDYSLPQYLYRSDLLDPSTLLSSHVRAHPHFAQEMLDQAIVHVKWDQGFPTILREDPLWARLEFEPENAFRCFLEYASQEGIRSIHKIDHESRDLVLEWFHMYYWMPRAKALDMFRAAHHYRLRERRILDLEDNHWIEGEKIMKRLQNAISNKTEEQLLEMDVDKLISSMERIAKIQRSAVGLSTSGGDQVQPKSTSVEVAIKNTTQEGPRKVEENLLDPALFEDPALLSAAQDLVIKVSNK